MKSTLDTEPAKYIRLDLFPADVYEIIETTNEDSTDESVELEVTTEHEFMAKELRVIVTDNYFYAIIDTINGPDFMVKEPLLSLSGSSREGYTVTTETSSYYIKRSTDCGCGSRLRSIHPFRGVPYVAKTIN